jgi:hypothetical protein
LLDCDNNKYIFGKPLKTHFIITLLSVRDMKLKILPQKQIIPLCNAVVVMILHPCAVPPQHNEKFGGKENTM